MSLQNFRDVLTDQPFLRWMLNSAIVAGATTVLGVFLACTAAYAFSRFDFPGRKAGMMSFLISQMFPGTLLLVPIYIIIVSWLHLGNSYFGLILVYSVTAIPFCVWMMKGYFDTIPLEIEESAIMDGASRQVIFFKIILPLAKPAVAVTALVLVYDGLERVHPGGHVPGGRDQIYGPGGAQVLCRRFRLQMGVFRRRLDHYFAAGGAVVPVSAEVSGFRIDRGRGQGMRL